ncbi:MAG: hypothetical protein KAG18_02310 [Sinobacterium sp.]|nr:hypothetical protein [Sinobacterium sp.]
MKTIKRYAGISLLASCLLAACSSQPMYSDVDVLKAKNKGNLYTLYEHMGSEYTLEKPSSERARNIQSYQEKVGLEIANEKEQDLLNRIGRDLSLLDIAALNKAKSDAVPIQVYNDAVYVALTARLDQEIFLKEKLFAQMHAEYQLLPLSQSTRKVELLDEMAAIAGGEQAESLHKEQLKYIAGLFEDAERNMKSQRYEQVVIILEQLLLVSSDEAALKTLEYALIEAEYEQQFWDALGAGDKNKSLELLKRLTAIPNYLQNNPDVLSIAKDLQALFLADADKKMLTQEVVSAYDDYSKANYIQVQLGTGKQYTKGEENFIRVIENKLIAAQEANNTVLSYGLLSILEELQYSHPMVEEFAPQVNNALLDEATIKILPRQLNASAETLEVAQVFSNALAKQLESALKVRVSVYDLSKQSSITEQDMSVNPGAWFEVTGDLLRAQISSENEAEQETKNVLVSYQTVVNPDYEAWSQLSSRKRKVATEPAATIEKEVYSDVAINRVVITKQASLSVSYRLVDEAKKKVLFFSSHDGEVIARGVVQKAQKVGLFAVDEQEAQLPLEADMMGQLVADAVMAVTLKLKPELAALNKRYSQFGEIAFLDKDYNKAAAQLAYADVLAQSQRKRLTYRKGLSASEKMRLSMIRWKSSE